MVNVEDFRESLLERLDVNNLERKLEGLKVGRFNLDKLEESVNEEFVRMVNDYLEKLGCSSIDDDCYIGISDEAYLRRLVEEFDELKEHQNLRIDYSDLRTLLTCGLEFKES